MKETLFIITVLVIVIGVLWYIPKYKIEFLCYEPPRVLSNEEIIAEATKCKNGGLDYYVLYDESRVVCR